MSPIAALRRTLYAWSVLALLVGADRLTAGDEFILRAPAAEAEAIAYRNGLTILEEIPIAGDPASHGLYRVAGPEGLSSGEVVASVEELEPSVIGIEPIRVASLPELDLGQPIEIDPSWLASLEQLVDTRALLPPYATAESWQLGDASHRTIKAIQIKKGGISRKSAELTFLMDQVENNRRDEVRLRADFAPGCRVEYNMPPPPLEAASTLEFSGRRVKWELTNHTDGPLTLTRIDVHWPAANQNLGKVKLMAEIRGSFEPPAASFDLTEVEEAEGRQINPGQTKVLELEFDEDVAVDQSAYSIAVAFAEGRSAVSSPCAVVAENDPVYNGDSLRWELTNYSYQEVTLESLEVGWPAENGVIRQVLVGLDPIFTTDVLPLSELMDRNGGQRLVWQGFVDQPAASVLGVPDVQGAQKGYSTVAIIDTGIDPDHWLLADALVPGYDFLRDQAGYGSEMEAALAPPVASLLAAMRSLPIETDDIVSLDASRLAIVDPGAVAEASPIVPPGFGHGTMVAGLIHRVAPRARIMPLRVFDSSGHADLLDIVEAVYYAVDHGANVINMSFSLESFSPELMRAVNYAARNGVACVASAGNHGREKIVYPAAFGNTLGVASSDLADQVSGFSNLGNDLVTVAAPGEAVVTTFPGGGWVIASGTSYAVPWVSGVAAIFADKNGREDRPGRADYYLASEALSHAAPVKGRGAGRAGHGRADFKQAVDKLKDGVAVGSSGEAEAPYLISAEFAQGCSVAYPPAVGGVGCAAEVSPQLELDGDKIGLWITNAGLETIDLSRVEISWPAAHEELKKVKLDGDSIFEALLPPPAAVVDSGWRDPDKPEKRQIAPGDTVELRFEFAEDLN